MFTNAALLALCDHAWRHAKQLNACLPSGSSGMFSPRFGLNCSVVDSAQVPGRVTTLGLAGSCSRGSGELPAWPLASYLSPWQVGRYLGRARPGEREEVFLRNNNTQPSIIHGGQRVCDKTHAGDEYFTVGTSISSQGRDRGTK